MNPPPTATRDPQDVADRVEELGTVVVAPHPQVRPPVEPHGVQGVVGRQLVGRRVDHGRVAQDDSHLQWEPAQARNLQNAGQTRVSIVIDKDEKLYLNGQQVSVDQLEPAITGLFGDALAGERAVVLKIHRDTTAHRFEPVLEAVSKAGGEIYHIVRDEGTQ